MEANELIALLQAGGTPVVGLVGYFLWKLDKRMSELKVSIDVLIETMIRFVPGIQPRNVSDINKRTF